MNNNLWKVLKIEKIKICLPNKNYCNSCYFKKYINKELKYKCVLFNSQIEKDGSNFIRLSTCKNAEVQNG